MSEHSGFELVGDITPDADNTRKLGSSSKRFAEIYVADAYFETAEGQSLTLWSSNSQSPGLALNHTGTAWLNGILIFQYLSASIWKIRHEGKQGSDRALRLYDEYAGNLIFAWLPTKVECACDFSVDTIIERTSGAGVTVDGVLLKDNGVTTASITAKVATDGISFENFIKVSQINERYSGLGVLFGSNIKTNKAHLRDTANAGSETTFSVTATSPDVVLVDLSTNSVTINLPPCADAEGRILRFIIIDQKETAPLNTLTLDPDGTETIDGNATKQYTPSKYSVIEIISTGSEWVIMNENLK